MADNRCEAEGLKVDESLFQVEMPTGQYGHKVSFPIFTLICRGESQWNPGPWYLEILPLSKIKKKKKLKKSIKHNARSQNSR